MAAPTTPSIADPRSESNEPGQRIPGRGGILNSTVCGLYGSTIEPGGTIWI